MVEDMEVDMVVGMEVGTGVGWDIVVIDWDMVADTALNPLDGLIMA